ncbi:ATP-dependent clp protease-like protein proteolytic subunit [Bimuria novae-zelandiae CBS 107.79]|uniref:ATP-dependent Clp protease proteolytic subunit n=1 Tax=Bimuria novae-zelandiae CBS 107.79 TaxID=1447943 RepID=A0A6A5VKX7_9PLEO|nr:ATP-dependent clp protease-like protein proteolytic subunit [Bimuria novae-zelandiae CBS 107.79]
MASIIRRIARPAIATAPPQPCARALSRLSIPPLPHTQTHAPPSQPTSWMPVPYVTETVAGGWRTSDIFSRLLSERIVCINGQVDDPMSATVTAQLLFLESDNPSKPISLYINSPGGSVTAGMAIYDTMNYIRCPITTICMGQAASMGSLLLAGGSPGNRFILPHSRVMIHQPSGGYSGKASDIADYAKEILRVRDQLNKIYQKHLTKTRTLEEIEKYMERDYFMDAGEALEFGIVDQILEKREAETETK